MPIPRNSQFADIGMAIDSPTSAVKEAYLQTAVPQERTPLNIISPRTETQVGRNLPEDRRK